MERPTKEGDSPVYENFLTWSSILSTIEHVKLGGKLGGPPSKAKYKSQTDSEPVPWGKGEKNRGSGVKKNLKLYAYKQFEGYAGSFGDQKAWERAYCRMIRRVNW